MKKAVLESKEKSMLRYSMISCFLLVILEIFASIFTQSQSVLMDAVYDGCELIIIFASLKIVPLLYKSTSEKHPYGFNQLESIIIIIKGIMMLSVTSGLLINNIQIFINGGKEVDYISVAIFQLGIAVISFIVSFFLKNKNKNLNSPMLLAEVKGWLIDGICGLGMGIAFLTPSIFNIDGLYGIERYLDQIVAIILSISLLPYPIKLLFNTFKDIFLFAPEELTMEKIKEITETTLESEFLNEISYDVIRTGRKLWISIYYKPINDTIKVSNILKNQELLKSNLKKEFSNVYLEILPDIEK